MLTVCSAFTFGLPCTCLQAPAEGFSRFSSSFSFCSDSSGFFAIAVRLVADAFAAWFLAWVSLAWRSQSLRAKMRHTMAASSAVTRPCTQYTIRTSAWNTNTSTKMLPNESGSSTTRIKIVLSRGRPWLARIALPQAVKTDPMKLTIMGISRLAPSVCTSGLFAIKDIAQCLRGSRKAAIISTVPAAAARASQAVRRASKASPLPNFIPTRIEPKAENVATRQVDIGKMA
mmetsp:Transcript_124224/g.215365  ORF Transcript_124224/g.215365 Transcript_124224/m.215365 type:complete len:230 (+) Transcript_124224:80-769(+)